MTHLYTEEYFRLVAESWQRLEERNKTPPPERSGCDVRGRFSCKAGMEEGTVIKEGEMEDEKVERSSTGW